MGQLQLRDGELQVPFRRVQGAVPEDFLNMAQVGQVLQKVGGATMPPDMAAHPIVYAVQFP